MSNVRELASGSREPWIGGDCLEGEGCNGWGGIHDRLGASWKGGLKKCF